MSWSGYIPGEMLAQRPGTAKVTLIGYTTIDVQAMHDATGGAWWTQSSVRDADALCQFAGQNCYDSFHNPAGRTNGEYLYNIIEQGHFSVFEHASATFHVSGVSRSLLTELTRHRHLSFSVRSQRYVDESYGDYVLPPDILRLKPEQGAPVAGAIGAVVSAANRAYTIIVDEMTAAGCDRKHARSAARSVLPNMWATEMVVTGNHRTWREVIQKRSDPGADEEIREFAATILTNVRAVAPALYQDMPG